MSAQPDVRIMYRSPVGTGDHDPVFADMARAHRLPGTEVHVTCMPDTDGRLTHIECRSHEEIARFGGFDEGPAFGNRLVVAPD